MFIIAADFFLNEPINAANELKNSECNILYRLWNMRNERIAVEAFSS